MQREVRKSEVLLLLGFCFIFLFMLLHDWLPLGSFNDVEAVSADNTVRGLVITTLINVGQIIILMGLLLFFIGKRYPIWVKLWLIIHQSSIFIGVMLSWWIPYLFGYGAEEKVDRYDNMFGNTHSFLPVRNGIEPNTIHTLFHAVLLSCIIVTIYICFTKGKKGSESKWSKLA